MEKQAETWTVLKVLDWTKGYLAGKGIENARLESEWLLCQALGLDRMGLYLNFEKPLNDVELADFRGIVARRAKREPLQYILGTQEFMGLDFEVSPGVLIPRHDTEVLVEEAVKRAGTRSCILDIGTGSGCIAIAISKALPGADIVGVDKSSEALDIARKNVSRHAAKVTLYEGSLFEPVSDRKFDLIVSNPPYIPSKDLEALQVEVRQFEPNQALDGGSDGLDYYRAIIPEALTHLNRGGWLLFEVGISQAEPVRELLVAAGFSDLFTARDPGRIDRVVGGRVS
jgi:release factor glutamine methyltransferase